MKTAALLTSFVLVGLFFATCDRDEAHSPGKTKGQAGTRSSRSSHPDEEDSKAEGGAAAKSGVRPPRKQSQIKTTASGLKYEVLQQGSGTVSPTETDMVEVHYHGTFQDGTVFDSSVERKEPISFGLSQVIPGWTEGLQLMREGDKFRFEIPAKLAYGERGAGDKIPPNSTLIFEVELLKIN